MFPVLFDLGGFRLHAYGAMASLGFIWVCVVVLRHARAQGWERERVVDILFYGALAGLVGARALYVLISPELLSDPSTWLDVRGGGLVFYGAVLTGLPVSIAVILRNKLPGREVFDIFGTALPVGHGISRLGCFLAGCCYGQAMDPPFGLHMGHHPLSVAPDHTVLPVQLIEAGGLFAIGALLTRRFAGRAFQGQIGLLWLLIYAAMRFSLEFLRGDPTRGFFLESALGQMVSTSQAVSVGVVVVAAALWRVWSRDPRHSSGPAAPQS